MYIYMYMYTQVIQGDRYNLRVKSRVRRGRENNGYSIPTQMLFHECSDKSYITTIQLDTDNTNAATGFDHIGSKIK